MLAKNFASGILAEHVPLSMGHVGKWRLCSSHGLSDGSQLTSAVLHAKHTVRSSSSYLSYKVKLETKLTTNKRDECFNVTSELLKEFKDRAIDVMQHKDVSYV